MMKIKRRKRCSHCEELFPPDEIVDGVCEECSEYYEWCFVCQANQYTEGDHCRHIFWTDCGWAGAGTYEGDWHHWKEPFFAFLDIMAKIKNPTLDDYPDLVTGIEEEVGKGAFWTRLEGPMLGTPDLYFYRLRPDLIRDQEGNVRSLFSPGSAPVKLNGMTARWPTASRGSNRSALMRRSELTT